GTSVAKCPVVRHHGEEKRPMVQKRRTRNGRGSLEEAMALLIQNQTVFLNRMGDFDRELIELKRDHDREFVEFKQDTTGRLANIESLLIRHEQILEGLPEAIRQKIGFKTK